MPMVISADRGSDAAVGEGLGMHSGWLGPAAWHWRAGGSEHRLQAELGVPGVCPRPVQATRLCAPRVAPRRVPPGDRRRAWGPAAAAAGAAGGRHRGARRAPLYRLPAAPDRPRYARIQYGLQGSTPVRQPQQGLFTTHPAAGATRKDHGCWLVPTHDLLPFLANWATALSATWPNERSPAQTRGQPRRPLAGLPPTCRYLGSRGCFWS